MHASQAVRRLVALALVTGALVSSFGTAHAAPCTVSLAATNPDGSLSDAVACDLVTPSGPGHSPAAVAAAVDTANPGGLDLTWSFIDRDPGSEAGQIESAFGITGTTTGTWLIDTDTAGPYNRFIVTMKSGNPLQDDVLWFLLDSATGANACSAAQQTAGWDLCGTWDMYGTLNGQGVPTAKTVSHMDLLGAALPEIQQTPEPSTTFLLALGALALLGTRNRTTRVKATR